MNHEDLQHRIERLRQRLETLHHGTTPTQQNPEENLFEALEELQTSLEELSVTEEELRQQNDELLAARQHAETERRRYQELFDFAPDGYLLTNAAGVIQEANQAAVAMLGLAQEQLVGKPLVVFVALNMRQIFRAHVTFLAEQQDTQAWEMRLQPRHRTALDVAVTVTSVCPPHEKTGSLRWLLRDITAHKQAEQALRDSEARYHAILDAAVDGIISIDAHGTVVSFNRSAERLFGYTASEVIGQNVTILMPAPYRDEHNDYLARYMRTHEPRIIGSGREVVGQRKDGSTFPIDLAVGEMLLQEQPMFVGIVKDITTHKQMYDEMQRAERLMLVGQLASGLAHEIGTPLNIIGGNAELLQMELKEQGTVAEGLTTIIEQSDRITRLVERLLSVSRPRSEGSALLCLDELLSRVLELVQHRFVREAISLDVDIPADVPPVWGNADQLEQVCLNVLVNAWHAMPQGGNISIQARARDQHQVCLSFRDTGHGMSAETLARAFEPFYTTKGRQGTGLGLMICQQIITGHSGTIQLESPPGEGVTVRIELPQAEPAAVLTPDNLA